MTAVETRSITKRYRRITAVDSLDLCVEQGEFFALLGVNGAGKTTLIRMLTGLCTPTEGDAFLCGHSVTQDTRAAKTAVSVSPQETAVARQLTVRENLLMMARLYAADKTTAVRRTEALLSRLGLEAVSSQRAGSLSGGWQRRLSIAMALASDSPILFLDEPTLGLDVLARRELWKVISSLKGKKTVILTTHYLEEAEALADRIGILSGGRLCAAGTAHELMSRAGTESFEDAFIKLSGGAL